jgi:hypothetical protein
MPVPYRGPPQMSVEQLDRKALEHWEASFGMTRISQYNNDFPTPFIKFKDNTSLHGGHQFLGTTTWRWRITSSCGGRLARRGQTVRDTGLSCFGFVLTWLLLAEVVATRSRQPGSNFCCSLRGRSSGIFFCNISICPMYVGLPLNKYFEYSPIISQGKKDGHSGSPELSFHVVVDEAWPGKVWPFLLHCAF